MNGLLVIDLHGNKIEGEFPDFPENNALRYLSLYENNIGGNIPASISNLSSLTHLDFSTNNLNGKIPDTIGSMESLTYLFLAANGFEAEPIPSFLQNLSNLKELSLKETSRNGSIPDWIGDLSELILLDLGYNNLSETIPAAISNLTKLLFLLLNRNELTGVVPHELSMIPSLLILLIDQNQISGLGKSAIGSDYIAEFCELTPNLGKWGSVFISDCGEPLFELECTCCTECCQTGQICNDGSKFLANHDLIWEHNYDRIKYVFSNDTAYVYQN